jgi:DHA2 family multidrug resistance protein
MLATFMQVDDVLSRCRTCRGAVSLAGPDRLLVTSYIVAAAIMTPLTGWLAGRFGINVFLSRSPASRSPRRCAARRQASPSCHFRLLQGVRAALVPCRKRCCSRSTRPSGTPSDGRHGVILGPITAGARRLPDRHLQLALRRSTCRSGCWPRSAFVFIRESWHAHREPFDFFGFATLSLAIGALQMLLDRGELKDWFGSVEIGSTIIAALALYLFVVHRDRHRPLVPEPRAVEDRNCMIGTVLMFLIGMPLYGTMTLLPLMLQNLMNYPVMTTGLVTAPRGVGTMIAMILCARLIGRVDIRLVIMTGLALTAIALWQMTGFTMQMGMGRSSPRACCGITRLCSPAQHRHLLDLAAADPDAGHRDLQPDAQHRRQHPSRSSWRSCRDTQIVHSRPSASAA